MSGDDRLRRLKKWIWPLLFGVAGVVALWLAGRSPTDYVLEQECRRYLEERRKKMTWFEMESGRLASKSQTESTRAKHDFVLKQQMEYLREHKSARIRGWDVLIIPAGAERPEPSDFLTVGRFTPGGPSDPPALRGPMEVWVAPRSGLAKVFGWLGL